MAANCLYDPNLWASKTDNRSEGQSQGQKTSKQKYAWEALITVKISLMWFESMSACQSQWSVWICMQNWIYTSYFMDTALTT